MKRVVFTVLFLSLSLLTVFQETYKARPSSAKLSDFGLSNDRSNASKQIGSLKPLNTAAPLTAQNTGPVRVVTLATGLKGASDVAVDSKYVYFTEVFGNAVERVSVTGGQVQTLANIESPLHLAIDSSYVYFNNASSIWRVSKNGGSPQNLFSQFPGVIVASLTLDDEYVYYTNSGAGGLGSGYVARIPKNGGTSETLLSGLNYPWGVAVDNDYAYFIQTGGECSGTDSQVTKGLWRVPKTGGGALRLTYSCTPWNVALDSGFAYFTDSLREGGAVIRVPKIISTPGTGGLSGVHDTISRENPSAQPIVADSYHVYYGESRLGGSVWRISKDGQEKTPLAVGQNDVQGLALGEGFSVYFAEFGKRAPCSPGSCSNPPDFTELGTIRKVEQVQSDFGLSVEPNYWTMGEGGGTCKGVVSVSSINGYSSTVDLSVPSFTSSGLTASFSPGSGVAPFQSVMTVSLAPNYLGGLSPPYTVLATGSGLIHSNPFMIEAVSWPDYCIFASPFDHQIKGGQPVSVSTVEVSPLNGFAQSVTLGPAWLRESPTGVTVSITPNPVSILGTAQLTLTGTSAPQPGLFSFRVRGPPAGAGIPARYSQTTELVFLGVKNDPGGATTGEGFYPVGQAVRLSTPDSLSGSAFSHWIIDQQIGDTHRGISVIMSSSRQAVAYYQTKASVDSAMNALKPSLQILWDSHTITNIIAAALARACKVATATYELDFIIPDSVREILRGLWEVFVPVPLFIPDMMQEITPIACSNLTAQAKASGIIQVFQKYAPLIVAYLTCVALVGVTIAATVGLTVAFTKLMLEACDFAVENPGVFKAATEFGQYLVESKVFDWIGGKLGDTYEWLKNNLLGVASGALSFGEWAVSGAGNFLKVFGGSNVTMLITDPRGNRLGGSLTGGAFKEVSEIQGGLYSGTTSHPQTLVIPNALPGVYTLQVTSQESGDFHLESDLFSEWALTNSTKYVRTVQIGTYTYELTYGTLGKSCCLFIGEPTSQLSWWWFWPLMVPIAGIASGLLVALVTRRKWRSQTKASA